MQLPNKNKAEVLVQQGQLYPNRRLYPVQIRPRFTWHGGESPVAYHKKKSKFDFK